MAGIFVVELHIEGNALDAAISTAKRKMPFLFKETNGDRTVGYVHSLYLTEVMTWHSLPGRGPGSLIRFRTIWKHESYIDFPEPLYGGFPD